MKALSEHEAHYQALMYQLLPQLYRSRDTKGDLQTFMALFGHELARIRSNMDQLWQDFYIDSCQEWVIPYIGDLVGTTILFNQGARNRADVKKTIHWRREKGTLAGLEDIAAEISGWGALAAEMFQELIWSQNLNHQRAQAIHALDLSDGSKVNRIGTAFDSSCRTVDIRSSMDVKGLYQIPNLGFWFWTIPSQPWVGADPVAAGNRRYFFSPLGRNQMLYAGGDKSTICASSPADICSLHASDIPIRGRDFQDNTSQYWGTAPGFGIYEDGILLCDPGGLVKTPSINPCMDFSELAALNGMVIADPGLFGAKSFRINAVRLAAKTTIIDSSPSPLPVTPAGPFSNNYVVDGLNGNVDSPVNTYAKGISFNPYTPDFHLAFMILRVKRLGADADFPECEVVLQSAAGEALLAFLPAVGGLAAGQEMNFYVADDGSTYFARATHDTGPIDLNPNSSFFGAYLPRHLARCASSQVRPRLGVRPLAHRQAVYRRLCCWDHDLQKPLSAGEVAIDPERGRFVFPIGEEPAGKLTVSFRFAITGSIGAGPYFRDSLPHATLKVAKTSDAPFRTIQAAINAAPAGSLSPVVIEIQDSHTYREALVVNTAFPGGICIQAKALEMPVVQSPGGDVLKVTADVSNLTLNGLVLAGGNVTINGNSPQVSLRFCSLDPQSSGLGYAPAATGAQLNLTNVITGPIVTSANVDSVICNGCAIQHPTGGSALTVAHAASLEYVTVAGSISAEALTVSNSILFGAVSFADSTSCFRYSCYPKKTAVARSFRCTNDLPIFMSFQFGHPAYLYLSVNTSGTVRSGGEDGGEMGVWYASGIPLREQNIQLKIGEYMPVGLNSVLVRAFPRTPFAGVRHI